MWYTGNFIFEPGHYEGHHGIYLCELDKETFQFKGKRSYMGWRKLAVNGLKLLIYFETAGIISDGCEGGNFTNHCVMIRPLPHC